MVNRRRGPRVRWDHGAIADDLSAGFFAGFDIGTMGKFAENEQKIDSIFHFSLIRYITHLLFPRTSVPRMPLRDQRSRRNSRSTSTIHQNSVRSHEPNTVLLDLYLIHGESRPATRSGSTPTIRRLPHAAAPRSVGRRAEGAAGAHRIRISHSGPSESVQVHRPGRPRAPGGSRISAAAVQEAPRIRGVPGSRRVGAAIPSGDDQGHGFRVRGVVKPGRSDWLDKIPRSSARRWSAGR